MTKPDQITSLQERIDTLKSSKLLTALDEFLIEAWKRNIKILEKQK